VGFNCEETGWWVDSAGAVVISVIILYRWSVIILECVRQIDGYKAPKELVDTVRLNPLC
jgi:divalent metal cation (Fe/Co/Zn/Cd) transporter